MLIGSVALYLLLTIAIGLWAARRVHNAKDYVVAGRSLPLYMTAATVFATWFGAETVLSVSATFTRDGLGGIVADPFGASFCLLFVALFFARAFYRMDLLTIGDFYRKRYSKTVEVITSVAITASYLGWTSAQLTALGLVFSVLSGGKIDLTTGILLGAAIVVVYTLWGGMWSVALTDLFQSVVILIGLTGVAWLVSDMAGGAGKVIAAASEAGKFEFWPKGGSKEWLAFLAAWMTLAIGSIPQQDVFQRVTSAKDEKTAVRATLLGGAIYFCFAFVPIFIAYSALVIDPGYEKLFAAEDAREIQRILPDLILNQTPMWAQVLFFGALLSAILSTASGAHHRADRALHRERDQALLPRHDRPPVRTAAARDLRDLHAGGAALRAQLEEHDVRDGAERLQGDAGVVHRAARRRHLLEARHHGQARCSRCCSACSPGPSPSGSRPTPPSFRRSSSAWASRSSAWCSERSCRA